jgi:hypothetical protein
VLDGNLSPVYVCMYVYVCVYIYIHIYRHINPKTGVFGHSQKKNWCAPSQKTKRMYVGNLSPDLVPNTHEPASL